VALVTAACAGAGLAAVANSGGEPAKPSGADPRPVLARGSASGAAGSNARFAFLARQNSNSCGLEPATLERMSNRMRLRGSCCFPMDLAAYKSQVRGLWAYRRFAVIPHDPYDIPVSLAKRMLAYDRTIRLSPEQSRVYSRAIRISRLGGPCCCHCWRWEAFRGLSEDLIVYHGWRAATVGRVIDLVEGCGGPAD